MNSSSMERLKGILSSSRQTLGLALAMKKSRRIGWLAGFIYFFLYLYTIGNLVYLPGFGAPALSVVVVDDWPNKIWKTFVPYIWEPVMALYITNNLVLFVAVPNLLMGLLLSTLIALNIAVTAYSFISPKACHTRSASGMLGAVPGLLSGFACCVPTFVIALGSLASGATLALIGIRPFFIPISILTLIAALLWSANRLSVSAGLQ